MQILIEREFLITYVIYRLLLFAGDVLLSNLESCLTSVLVFLYALIAFFFQYFHSGAFFEDIPVNNKYLVTQVSIGFSLCDNIFGEKLHTNTCQLK